MDEACVDVNVLLRLLTGDDPRKQQDSLRLFREVEEGRLTLYTPDTTIADAIYVLTSTKHYRQPRAHTAAQLIRLVRMPHFKVKSRRMVLRALGLFATAKDLDFGDAMIIAQMEQQRLPTVYSYDSDFDDFSHISRQEQ